MRTIFYLVIALIVITLAGVLAFGQENRLAQRPLQQIDRVQARTRASSTAGAIGVENVNSYFIGYDFEAAAHLVAAGKTREALAQLAFLWDELSGQPESQQIESVMRMVIRGEGTSRQAVQKLELAQTGVEAKLRGDRRWYYDVGKTYSEMFITASNMLDTPDLRTFRQKLVSLGTLAKTAPAGTPAEFVSALAKLGEFGIKQTMSEQDINAMASLWETIDNTISA